MQRFLSINYDAHTIVNNKFSRKWMGLFQVPAGTNSRRSSRGVSQQPPDEQMRRSMSLAGSQQEVSRYPRDEEESSYASQSSNGRRASEANYSSPARYDRSNNVRIKIF